MSKKQLIPGAGSKVSDLAQFILSKFGGEGYECQRVDFEELVIIQCRNTRSGSGNSVFSSLTGMDAVATLKIAKIGPNLEIESSAGKWLDKAAVMGISIVVLWPLFVTSSIGFYKQNKLVGRLFDEAMLYLSSH